MRCEARELSCGQEKIFLRDEKARGIEDGLRRRRCG
jgi:hypothetical protein